MANKEYYLPILDKGLLKNVIFSMENQNSKGFLDLETGEIVEVKNKNDVVIVKEDKDINHNIALKISDNLDRFLSAPQWGPLEGFKMREQFVSIIKNPSFELKLDKALHTGRGVFRKFKDILHTNPIILRKWYTFKADYMKAIVVQWYEYNKGVIDLEKLPVDIEELPSDLLLEEFQIEYSNTKVQKKEIQKLKELCFSKLSQVEKILLKRRFEILKNPEYLSVLSNEDLISGYIEYEKISEKIVEVISYAIEEEYRGLGLFFLLLDKFMRQMKREGYSEVLLYLPSSFMKNNKFMKKIDYCCNLNYFIVDISVWIETMPTMELLEV